MLFLEPVFRWSKLVEPDREVFWETVLHAEEVDFVVERDVRRKRLRISSYCMARDDAEALRRRHGGGVTRVDPEQWHPSTDPGAAPVLRIRDRLIVCETDDTATLQRLGAEHPDRAILSFPPQLAFGTGQHPTTANCLRLLVDAAPPLGSAWEMLDLGCGTGILSIAAIRLGAERAQAVEVDPVACDMAGRNAERHGVSERIAILQADAETYLRDADFSRIRVIAANLYSELLQQLLPVLAGKPARGTTVILSGFLTSQAADVTETATRCGFPLERFLRRGSWVAASGVATGHPPRL